MNEQEAHYSQPELELYGLYCTLQHFRLYIIGVKNLIVEVNSKYIKEMLNHPNLQPNAIINQWIKGILTFTFKLVHVPAKNFKGTDGLSRQRRAEDDSEIEDDEKDDEEDDDEDIQDWFSNPPIFYDTLHLFSQTLILFCTVLGGLHFKFSLQEFWTIYWIKIFISFQHFNFLLSLQSQLENVSSNNPELFHQGRQIVETTSFKSPTCYSQHQSTQQKSSTHS